jgi:hypothetical protein
MRLPVISSVSPTCSSWKLMKGASAVGMRHVVEHVRLQGRDRAGKGVNLDRLGEAGRDRVDHQRQGRDVIQVGVREQDMVDALHLVEGQVSHTGAGVNEHVAIEQE